MFQNVSNFLYNVIRFLYAGVLLVNCDKPVFREMVPRVTVTVGKDVTLYCTVDNLGSYKVCPIRLLCLRTVAAILPDATMACLFVRTGGLDPRGQADDIDDPHTRHHTQFPVLGGQPGSQAVDVAHQERPRGRPRLLHVPNKHRSNELAGHLSLRGR